MEPKLIAAWVAIATGIVGIVTFVLSLLQRRQELRWRRAELARRLLDDVFANDSAAQGLDMLDGVKRRYKDFDDLPIEIKPDDVVVAVNLALAGSELDSRQAKILFCIDTVLYYFVRIESSLNSGLVLFRDVKTPCEYYVGLLARYRGLFRRYMEQAKYADVVRFCERFSVWRNRTKTGL